MTVIINGDTGISPVTASGTSASVDGMTVGRGSGEVATNTAVGASALTANTSGSNNVAVGYQAAYANTEGTQLTAVGYLAVASNTTGYYATGIGAYALNSNTTGDYNTAVGRMALRLNTTGANGTALGYQALYSNTTASNNTAVGYGGLQYNITGTGNSALGYRAGWGVTSNYNTAIGMDSMSNASGGVGLTSGANNTAVGYQTFYNLTSGGNNTAVGYQALYTNSTGADNTAIGHLALTANTTGSQNVAVGKSALVANTTGSNNISLGWLANNFSTTGSYITAIGYNAYPNTVADTNELIITCVTGGTGGKGTNTGFITVGTGGIYQGNNSSAWSTTSDRRLKKSIVDNNIGLEKITALQVRNFEYCLPEEVTELDSKNAIAITGVQLGVIAQEIQQILPDCVKTESSGVMSVDTSNLTWYMINAIKDLKAELDTVKAELAALKG
jgi:trimeric autotransporter adhesin